jgi:hypothetical protein
MVYMVLLVYVVHVVQPCSEQEEIFNRGGAKAQRQKSFIV